MRTQQKTQRSETGDRSQYGTHWLERKRTGRVRRRVVVSLQPSFLPRLYSRTAHTSHRQSPGEPRRLSNAPPCAALLHLLQATAQARATAPCPISPSTEIALTWVQYLFQNQFKTQPEVCPAKNAYSCIFVIAHKGSPITCTYIYKKRIFFAWTSRAWNSI